MIKHTIYSNTIDSAHLRTLKVIAQAFQPTDKGVYVVTHADSQRKSCPLCIQTDD